MTIIMSHILSFIIIFWAPFVSLFFKYIRTVTQSQILLLWFSRGLLKKRLLSPFFYTTL